MMKLSISLHVELLDERLVPSVPGMPPPGSYLGSSTSPPTVTPPPLPGGAISPALAQQLMQLSQLEMRLDNVATELECRIAQLMHMSSSFDSLHKELAAERAKPVPNQALIQALGLTITAQGRAMITARAEAVTLRGELEDSITAILAIRANCGLPVPGATADKFANYLENSVYQVPALIDLVLPPRT